MKLKVGSLFSGIGGIELGLERTGHFETIWNCEIDPWASAVLKKHWPGVENLGDITKIGWERVRQPQILVGGFPCQNISRAGRGGGIRAGEKSGLWREFAKAIRILRPRYVLVENVPEIINRGLDVVITDLASCGYSAIGFPLSYRLVSENENGKFILERERFFTFAHSERGGIQRFWKEFSNPKTDEPSALAEGILERREHELPEPPLLGVGNGFPKRVDRTRCLGNAVVPQVAQIIGEWIAKDAEKENELGRSGANCE